MEFEFWKMHGTGNDFVVVNNFDRRYSSWPPQFIKEVCQRHTGVGADGLLFIEPSTRADFRMRYFNADGSESSMCANGSRCISYFAYKNRIIGQQGRFEAGDGIHAVRIENSEHIAVQVLYSPIKEKRTFPVDFTMPKFINFKRFINTGVPHLVLEVTQIRSVPVLELGRALRYHPYYLPEGTNIDFVEIDHAATGVPFRLKVRTYERGVEDETLSCGSGVTAAVLSFLSYPLQKTTPVEVETCGGNLTVTVSGDLHQIYLEGPVQVIYQAKYLKEGSS
jgi:diaminopimelate epimerase